MNDKEIMENLLIGLKQCGDLMLHGAEESSTPKVHGAFSTALNSTVCMQSDVYRDMAERGWYPPDQAPQQKLDAVKQKYQSVS